MPVFLYCVYYLQDLLSYHQKQELFALHSHPYSLDKLMKIQLKAKAVITATTQTQEIEEAAVHNILL